MAPVAKRLTIDSTGSTSSSGTGAAAGRSVKSPRSVAMFRLCSSTARVYSLKIRYCPLRVACWSFWTVSGLNRWNSPSRRHWYSPPQSSSAGPTGRSGKARSCRRRASSAMTSRPIPLTRESVPVK